MQENNRKHFAQLDENNVVIRVGVFDAKNALDENGEYQESLAIAWYKTTFGNHTNWVETSKTHSFRTRAATKGYTYNSSLDAFIRPQPYPSWSTLNSSTKDWEPPIAKPILTEEQVSQGKYYVWDESAYQSQLGGWVLQDNPY